MRRFWLIGALAAAVAMSLPAAPQAATTITELSAGVGPVGLAAGADGNVWFVDLPNPGMIGESNNGSYTANIDRQAGRVAGAIIEVFARPNCFSCHFVESND